MENKKPKTSETTFNPPAKTTTIMEMLINKATNRDIIKAMASITIADTTNTFPAISQLNKQYTPQRVENALTALIIDASGYFENALTENQARDVAVEIKTQYYYLSLEDIYLALKKLKSEYIYGKLTQNKLLSAASAYANEKTEMAATRSLNAHLAQKNSRINYTTAAQKENQAFAQFKQQYNNKTKPPHQHDK